MLTPRKTSIYSATLNNTVVIEMAKKYIPNEKEKYMCAKHKAYFKQRLIQWRNEIIESNNKSLFLNEVDHEISSPDIIEQATSQTEKTV